MESAHRRRGTTRTGTRPERDDGLSFCPCFFVPMNFLSWFSQLSCCACELLTSFVFSRMEIGLLPSVVTYVALEPLAVHQEPRHEEAHSGHPQGTVPCAGSGTEGLEEEGQRHVSMT